MKGKGLSIVVIAFNEEKYLPRLLSSLEKQTYKDFQVIVVDSNSTDNTFNVAMGYKEKFKEYHYLKLDFANGPAYARNQGVQVANYERVLFLDADSDLKFDFIERIMAELLKKQPDVASCRMRIAESNLSSYLGAYFLNAFMILLKPIYSSGYGACFISTKTVHEKLNGFDESIGICEDCNYLKRARREFNFKYTILNAYFYTSDRRAKAEGGLGFLFKYVRIHLFRLITGKEILRGQIVYNYGDF